MKTGSSKSGRSRGLEVIQTELEKRVYYLRTLYDVSNELFGTVQFDAILHNFTLMTMGNFGVPQAFIMTCDPAAKNVSHLVSVGFDEEEKAKIKGEACEFLAPNGTCNLKEGFFGSSAETGLPSDLVLAVPFQINDELIGLLGLGQKLTEEPYTREDKELLGTLVNNLVVALKNALSFEEIKRLNEELTQKNIELEEALKKLQAAIRKVELLESIKANLCKFVPATVTRMIEESPTFETMQARERDMSVMFLDIEGYTKLTEEVGGTEVNSLVERYFSVFMDAIYANNGDVMETSGDGLMVLFLSPGAETNALEAVRAALTIREKTNQVNQQSALVSRPLAINIGITSGEAFVGASKFDSVTGSRWAYTAHGNVVNMAARICSKARGGAIYANEETVRRVSHHFGFQSLGKFRLKNLSEEVEIYELTHG